MFIDWWRHWNNNQVCGFSQDSLHSTIFRWLRKHRGPTRDHVLLVCICFHLEKKLSKFRICGLTNIIWMVVVMIDNRDLTQDERLKYGIKDNLVRFSFGVEDFEDVKADILQALEAIWKWYITQNAVVSLFLCRCLSLAVSVALIIMSLNYDSATCTVFEIMLLLIIFVLLSNAI